MKSRKPRFEPPPLTEADMAGGALSASGSRLGNTSTMMLKPHSLAKNAAQRSRTSPAHKVDWQSEDKPMVFEDLKKSHGRLCYNCGSETAASGTGLRACPACHCIQLNSGMMSHAYSMAHPEESKHLRNSKSRSALAGKGNDDDAQGASELSNGNGLAIRKAWSQLTASMVGDMARATAPKQGPSACALDCYGGAEERAPIRAGSKETPYRKGDRVKSTMRLTGSCPGAGWDLINCETGQGTVLGAGRSKGEILVKMDYSGHDCSLKMAHISPVNAPKPRSTLERMQSRRMNSRVSGLP